MKNYIGNIVNSVLSGNTAELKRAAYFILLLVFGGMLGNIVFTLLTTNKNLLDVLASFRPPFLILAMVLALMPWLTNTMRVLIWTRFLGHKISFVQIFKIVICADLGSAFSPTAIGGGYVKAGMLAQRGLSVGAAASLMTLGSVEDGLFFFIAVPVSIYLSKCWDMPVVRRIFEQVEQNTLTMLAVLVALLMIFLLYRILSIKAKAIIVEKPRLVTKIRARLAGSLSDFLQVYKLIGKSGKSCFAVTMTLTAVQWICRYSVLSAMLLSVGVKADPVLFFLLQWVTFTLMTFIPTPGAMAGAEASFYLVYTSLLPKETLGLMTDGWRFLTFYLNIILALMLMGVFLVANLRKSH